MNSKSRILLGLALLAFSGCGSADPRAEVIGEVTLNGEPVEEAQIYLSAKSPDRKAAGTYSASVIAGSFGFLKHEGPPPGEYEVVVQPVEQDSEEVFDRMRESRGKALAGRDRFLQAVARKGPIRVELTADDVNEVIIELTTR